MKTKRFLSIALVPVIMLGMLRSMSLTASASDGTTQITPSNTSGTMTITLTIGAAGGENTGPSTGSGSGSGPSTGSGTGGSQSKTAPTENEVTLPVSFDKGTGAVPVNVSNDGNVSIKEAGSAALKEVLESHSASGDVVIDAGGIGRDISSVTLTSGIMGEIVNATNDGNNDAKIMTIKMTEGSLSFDGSALLAIYDQADGDDIRFNLKKALGENLSAEQRKTLKDMTAEKILDAFVTSNGKRISDFKGGRAVVEVPHTIRRGMERAYHVWYVSANGQKTSQARQILEKSIRFLINHMSNYVIEYDPGNLKGNDEFDLTVQTAAKRFADVPEGVWFENAVKWAVENGITTGTDETSFSPKKDCSRGEMITFIWRMKKSPEKAPADIPFTDVPAKEYFAKAVAWAYSDKVTSGTSKTTFSPALNCSRAEFVTFLWRLAGSPGTDKKAAFDDVDLNSYYAGAVAWAADNGITSGASKTGFAPDNACSRAEAVTFLHRYSKVR